MNSANMSAQTLRYLIDQDFRSAWDAMARDADITARGNFMFAREAVALLELACRVCVTDATGTALDDLSTELAKVEPLYFTELPGTAQYPRDFVLPSLPGHGPKERQLIAVIFDLIRHGQAHQRQQTMVSTADGHTFGFSLTGAGFGRSLIARTSGGRPAEHLSVLEDHPDVYIVLCPEMLFLDLQAAIEATGVFTRGLDLEHLERPRPGSPHYNYTAAQAKAALLAGNHPVYLPPPSQVPPSVNSPPLKGEGMATGFVKRIVAAFRRPT